MLYVIAMQRVSHRTIGTPNQGKLLHLLVKPQGARKILELGTLGGYTHHLAGAWIATGGRVVSLEANPKAAEVAKANIARAGLSHIVDIRIGKAIESLPLFGRRKG